MRGRTELDLPFLLCQLGQVAAHGWVTNRYAGHSYRLLDVIQRHLAWRRECQLECFVVHGEWLLLVLLENIRRVLRVKEVYICSPVD